MFVLEVPPLEMLDLGMHYLQDMHKKVKLSKLCMAVKRCNVKPCMLSLSLLQRHDKYAKFGALATPRQVLEALPFRNVVSWNAAPIARYAQEGQVELL